MIPRQTHYFVRIERPALWLGAAAVLIAIILVALWLAFEQGQRTAGYDSAEAGRYVRELEKQIASLEADLDESRRRAAMLERNSRIDDDAGEQLKMTLSETQQEVIELKKELSFYKSIVAPEQTKRSVVIQTVQLKPDRNGGYEYKIMVTQEGRNDNFARGNVEVEIEGNQEGESKVLELTELSEEAAKSMRFGFRYFQNFTGKMKLPENFEADSVRVKLVPDTKVLDPVDETFPWDDLTAGG